MENILRNSIIGDKFTSPSRTITEVDITIFAGLSGDYNPLYTDEEFAKKIFGGRIAHGLLTFSITLKILFACIESIIARR